MARGGRNFTPQGKRYTLVRVMAGPEPGAEGGPISAWKAAWRRDTCRSSEQRENPIDDSLAIEPGGWVVESQVHDLGVFQHHLALFQLRGQAQLDHRRPPPSDIHHPNIAAKFIGTGHHDALVFTIDTDDRQGREPGVPLIE